MRAWAILFLSLAVGAYPLRAACGREPTVRDWGLHRAWVAVGDCAHPERPEQLREIAWRNPAAPAQAARDAVAQDAEAQAARPAADEPAQQARRRLVARRAPAAPPEVRAGMQVSVSGADADAEVFLVGTAIGTARRGETVAVRLGLHSAVVRGIVRGPATVELIPGRVER